MGKTRLDNSLGSLGGLGWPRGLLWGLESLDWRDETSQEEADVKPWRKDGKQRDLSHLIKPPDLGGSSEPTTP